MNGLPYYKAYPRDFFDGTAGMSFEVKSAYRLLLDLIYMHGGRLVDEPRFIAGHLNCSVKKWTGLRAAVLDTGKIFVSDGYLGNLRADKELDSLKLYQAKQRENGSQPKKTNCIAGATAKPSVNHTESESDPVKVEGGGARDDEEAIRGMVLSAIGVDSVSGQTRRDGTMLGTQSDMAEVARWLDLPGLTFPRILAEVRRVMAGKSDGPPSSLKYFSSAMQRLSGELCRPPLDPIATKLTTGAKHDRKRFDQAFNSIADDISAGTVGLRLESRDPFPTRSRSNA